MLHKRKHTPAQFSHRNKAQLPLTGKYAMGELGLILLAALFMGSVGAIAVMMEFTLLPILTASRFFIAFGLIGFLIAYLFRKQLQIGVLDGLYYNLFAVAPLCMVAFLGINMLGQKTYTETHRITDRQIGRDGYVVELENGAYEEFWRIRNLQIEERPAQATHIEFTFRNGLLGYKVLQHAELR